MTWADIETKWAAMARRVQSDTTQDTDRMTSAPAPTPTPLPEMETTAEMGGGPTLERPVA